MNAEIKANKKKLTASLVLFFLAVILLLALVLCLITPLTELLGTSIVFPILAGITPLTCFFLIDISYILNASYRKEVVHAGTLSTVVFVLCSIVVITAFVIIVIMLFFAGALDKIFGSSGPGKTITITGEDGKEYKLTQKDTYGYEFTDQNDDLWMTQDHGETFKRVSVRIRDDNGSEVILTPRFGANDDKYYQDENGNYWTTYNSGYSYEREDWRR